MDVSSGGNRTATGEVSRVGDDFIDDDEDDMAQEYGDD